MKKMMAIFGTMLISGTVFANEGNIDLSSLENANLVGLTMHLHGATVEFKQTGFNENTVAEDGAQMTCFGKYAVVKSLLGSRAGKGNVFLHFTQRKCSVSETDSLISFYVELPQKIFLAVETPIIEGSLDRKSSGRIKKSKSLEGTGDYDEITFSK